jgi:hypothetical protein
MIDKKFTEDMQTWLAAETHDHDSLVAGAEMVLRLTRNRAMYQTIMRRPKYFENKIRYELNKFLRMRLDEMTIQDVKELSAELTPKVKVAIDEETKFIAENAEDEETQAKFLPAASGIRADHDTLPEDVASVWKDNRERWFRIKQLYNTLLTIDKPCDRYEYLKQLKELWYKYKSELERYDNYVADDAEAKTNAEGDTPVDIAKDITNARSYITKNIGKLIELRQKSLESDENTKELADYNKLLAKVQERVAILTANNAPIGDDLKAKLNEAGLSIPSAE